MKKLLILLCFSNTAFGASYLNLELRKIEFKRHAYYPDKRDWRGYTGLNWGVQDLWDTVYWENTIYAYGDSAQYRHVGWKWELGVNLYDNLHIFYHHHSEHAMDANREDIGHPDKWPIEDSFGIRINLLHD